MSIGNIGTLRVENRAELPPLGQPEGATVVRAKPTSTAGVSQRALDWAYIGKELGYPYVALFLSAIFVWYGFAWAGPNVITPALEPLASVAKTNAILATREVNREEYDMRIEKHLERTSLFMSQIAENSQRQGESLREIREILRGQN